MEWYWKALICVVGTMYLIGYIIWYIKLFKFFMEDHPMKHSANYRLTDGHFLAFFFSFFWPFILLLRELWKAIVWFAKLTVKGIVPKI